MHRKDWFAEFYFNRLRHTDEFMRMDETVEESPWHREKNVRVHTDMVVAQYMANATTTEYDINTRREDWSVDTLVGALACAFHDIGKPASLTWKHSEERGDYKTFAGHELVSARLWEDFFVKNFEEFKQVMSAHDFWKVAWLIEHHLPYRISKPYKVEMLHHTLRYGFDDTDILTKILTADCWGRISDDHEAKKRDVENWVETFWRNGRSVPPMKGVSAGSPYVTMLIGASGSGKSTFVQKTPVVDRNVFSLDRLRHKWYGEDYRVAFESSCADNTFASRSQHRFIEMLKTRENLIVDNTNTSTKSRRFYIDQARRNGYGVKAVLFPVSLETVLARQHTRGDKNVPEEAVRRQYMNLHTPSLGEFDEIVVSHNNL